MSKRLPDILEAMETATEQKVTERDGFIFVDCGYCGEEINISIDDYQTASPNPYSAPICMKCVYEGE